MKRSLSSSRRAAFAALPRLVLKRAFSEKTFVGLRVIGLTIAVAVSAGVFIYLDALGQSALSQSLSGHSQQNLDIAIRARIDSITNAAHRRTIDTVRASRSGDIANVLSEPTYAAKSVTLVFDREVVPWKTARTFLAHVDGLRSAATLVEGTWPRSSSNANEIEVAVSAGDSTYLGLGAGDSIELSSPTSDDIRVTANITGVYEINANVELQRRVMQDGLGARSDAFRFAPMVVDENALIETVKIEIPDTEIRYFWIFRTDVDAIDSRTAERLLAGLETQQNLLKQDLQGYQRISSLDDALESFLSSSEISRGLMLSIGADRVVGAGIF